MKEWDIVDINRCKGCHIAKINFQGSIPASNDPLSRFLFPLLIFPATQRRDFRASFTAHLVGLHTRQWIVPNMPSPNLHDQTQLVKLQLLLSYLSYASSALTYCESICEKHSYKHPMTHFMGSYIMTMNMLSLDRNSERCVEEPKNILRECILIFILNLAGCILFTELAWRECVILIFPPSWHPVQPLILIGSTKICHRAQWMV